MPHSTLKATLLDRLHEQAQDRQTRYAFLKTDARCLQDQAAEVYAAYTFTRADELCRCTPSGICTQAAMTLTGPSEQVTVVCSLQTDNLQTEEPIWFITDMTGLHFPASVYIRATQARIDANKADANRKAVQA